MSVLRILKDVLKSVPQLFAVVNTDGQIVYRNPRFDEDFAHLNNIFELLTVPHVINGMEESLTNRISGSWDSVRGKLTLTYLEDDLFSVLVEHPIESLDAFRQISATLDANVMIFNDDDICIWANGPVEFVIGLNLRQFTPPDLLDEALEILERVRTHKEFTAGNHSWMMGHDGEQHCFEARWLPILNASQSQVPLVALVSYEITQEVLADEALQRSEERYRNVLNNSLDVICVYSPDLTIQHITPNIFEYTGFTPEELVGQNMASFAHPDELASLAHITSALNQHPETAVTAEARILRKDGSYATTEARIRWVDSFDGKPVIISNARDIGVRRELETMRQTLLRADKLASIGQLAAGVAHEINNPAAYIATNLFVLKQYVLDFIKMGTDLRGFAMRLDSESREFYLNYIKESEIEFLLEDMRAMIDTNLEGMERIKHIVSELRGYSRDEGQDVEVFDPNGVVETVSAIARTHIGASGTLIVGLGDVPHVLAHRGKLTQVLINLLVNAAQAIEKLPGEQLVRITTYRSGEDACIAVSDTGGGIPEELQEHIFDPFFTTKTTAKGTGLGLWLCREIMTQLKGKIVMETSPQGTSFTISLPLVRTEDTVEAVPVKFGRVLIVDHLTAGWIPMCSDLLHPQECVRVSDVSAAIGVLETDQAFDLVVCPLPMLEHQGRDLYAEIRAAWPGLAKRVLVLVPPEIARDVPSGVKSCLLPRDLRDLKVLLQNVMEES